MIDGRVTIEAGGVIASLESLTGRGDDLTAAWEGPVSRLVREMEKEVFATEGASIGKPWASLSPLTLKLKAAQNREKMGTLRLTNALYRSLYIRAHPEQIHEVSPQQFVFGTRDPKAARHQSGWTINSVFGRPVAPRSILPRPVMPDALPESYGQRIEDALALYVIEGKA